MTYRIYDYNRLGLDGRPRELHTELAKEAIDYHVYSDYRVRYDSCKDEEVPLVRCPFFSTSLLDLDRPFTLDLRRRDSFLVLMDVGGDGVVRSGSQKMELGSNGCLLVPASVEEIEFTPGSGGLKMLIGQL
jgi:mannose-6-phosphate isomerase